MEIQNWVHVEPPVLHSQGRATEAPKPDPADDEPAEDEPADDDGEPAPEKKDPINPQFTQLSRDKQLVFSSHSKKECPPWVVRKAYCQPTEAAVRTYLAKSLRWPGACCYANVRNLKPGAEVVNMYIGDGLKGGETAIYAPQVPGTMATEFPTKCDQLQTDCTPDDEAEFQKPEELPAEAAGGDDDEEGDGEDGGDE